MAKRRRRGSTKSIVASRRNVYRAPLRRGYSKSMAARIANAGSNEAKRSAMARKAARTRTKRRR